MRFWRTSRHGIAVTKLLARFPETASQAFFLALMMRWLSCWFFYLFSRWEKWVPLLLTSFLPSHSLGVSLTSGGWLFTCTTRKSLFRTTSLTCGSLSPSTLVLCCRSLSRSLYPGVLLLTFGCALVSTCGIAKAMTKNRSTYGTKYSQRTDVIYMWLERIEGRQLVILLSHWPRSVLSLAGAALITCNLLLALCWLSLTSFAYYGIRRDCRVCCSIVMIYITVMHEGTIESIKVNKWIIVN